MNKKDASVEVTEAEVAATEEAVVTEAEATEADTVKGVAATIIKEEGTKNQQYSE